jgi:hypothetical protein
MQNGPIMIPHFSFGQPVTLAQLRQEIEAWLKGAIQDDDLPLRVEQLMEAVREAEGSLRQEMESRQQTPELEVLFSGAVEAYQEMESCLEAISAGVRASDREAVAEELARLNEAGDSLRERTEGVENWLNDSQARCPQCGFGSKDAGSLCPHCQLELLYPDLSPDPQSGREFLTLGADYISLYKTYLAVLEGQSSLSELRSPLERLQGVVVESSSLLRSHPEVHEACAQILAGIGQMAAAFSSHEASDLNQGWFRIFCAAGELQQLLRPLLQGSSVESGSPGSDSFELSG